MISKANEDGRMSGLCCQNGPNISHLFADDCLFFCRVENRELVALRNILKEYELTSGEAINLSKSAIQFSSKMNDDRKMSLSSALGVNNVNDFGKYLGVPSIFSRNKSKDLTYVLDRIWKTVQGWKNSFFSIAGKEIFIKSIGQAIPSYIMSVFRLPKHIHKEINRSFSRFWWGSSNNKRKLHWFKWNDICLHKSLGRLNF